MLGNQLVKGSSLVQGTRPAPRLGHLSSNRIITHVKEAPRRRAAAPALKQQSAKASYPSAQNKASHTSVRAARRKVATQATKPVQAESASPAPKAKASLTAVLIAVAVASLGALLFGLHVAIVNGLQDAVSADLGFSGNTGLRGAVSLCAFARLTSVGAQLAVCLTAT